MSMTAGGVDILATMKSQSSLALARTSALAASAAARQASTAKTSGTSSAKDSTTTSSSDSSGDITSADFLTLLVTEMQNQDPTQPTDPNAYIQQLVEVNSLQQLISINGELGGSATSQAQQGAQPTSSVSAIAAATSPSTASLFGPQTQQS